MSTTTFNSIGADRVNIDALFTHDTNWHTIDLSAYVPVGATAAILEFKNTGSSTAGSTGVRHPSSGVNTSNYQYATSRLFLLAPLDGSRQTTVRATSTAFNVYIHGCTMSGVTMLTNRVSIGSHPGPSYAFVTRDLSAYAPNATALIFEHYSVYPNAEYSTFRYPGSSDAAQGAHVRYHGFWVVKANAGVCEWSAASGYNQAYLVGYITETEPGGFSMRTNIVPMNPPSGGTEYQRDLSRYIPVGSEKTLFNCGAAGTNSRLRKNAGYSADYNYTSAQETIPVPPDTDQTILETLADVTFNRIYFQGWAAQVPWYLLTTEPVSDIDAFKAAGNASIQSSPDLDQIDEYGFDYGTSPGVYTQSVTVVGSPGSTFSMDMTGLYASYFYYCRAKMHHPSLGWIYGQEARFKTGSDPSLVLFEKQNSSEITEAQVYGVNWKCQTFTPTAGHVMRSIVLRIRKTGSPSGYFIASIRATDGSGQPTGPDLTTPINIPPDTISTSLTNYEYGLGAGLFVQAATKYAIVVRAPSTNSSNDIRWRLGSDVYGGNQSGHSGDNGATWSMQNNDHWFEERGTPLIQTLPATDVVATQAVGNGYFDDPANLTDIGFEWGTTPGGPYPNQMLNSVAPFFAGDYSLVMSPLNPSQTYYYRAKINHSTLGWIYGNEENFTTPVAVPVARTDPPTAVSSTTIDAVGNILSTGGDPTCDRRGFVYGLTSQPDPGNVAPGASGYDAFDEETGSFGTGSFTRQLSGLSVSKIYYYRAYCHNSFGYDYGEELAYVTNTEVNILFPESAFSSGIRFDSSPGGGYPNPFGGTIAHYILCRDADVTYATGGRWGYISGNLVYERNYYNDNFYTDLYGMANPLRRTEGIVKVKWKARVIRNGYPYGEYKRELYTHATQYSGAALDIPAPVVGPSHKVCEIFYNNPNTLSGWTLSEADAINAGITLGHSGGFGVACCDQVLIYVLWANAAVTTVAVTRLTGTTAKLDGHVDEDEAEECQVYFEWGETVAYGNTTTPQTKALGDTFTDTLSGLDPSKTYHARAVIVTECGETFYGADLTIGLLGGGGRHIANDLVREAFI